MDSMPFGLRLIIALPVWLLFGLLISYCQKPEDFLIKRLRPKEDARFSHSQLLFRALAGAGLSALLLIIGVGIITSDEAFLEWRSPFITVTVVIGLFMGIHSYLYFRIWRYVEIAPSGQSGSDSSDQRLFMRRAEPNPKTRGLRLTLIILAAVTVVAGPAIFVVLAVLTSELFSQI